MSFQYILFQQTSAFSNSAYSFPDQMKMYFHTCFKFQAVYNRHFQDDMPFFLLQHWKFFSVWFDKMFKPFNWSESI